MFLVSRNKRETDLVSVCFGSNRKLFLFVSRTPYFDLRFFDLVSQFLPVFVPVFWILIRIRMDPHHFGNLNPHPDPHQIKSGSASRSASDKNPDPHLIKIRIWIRIRITVISWDPGPHRFADVQPKCLEY
jgi:hypothetical protein